MKVNLEDIEVMTENPIEAFYSGLKAEATKDRYTRILRYILCDVFENSLTGSFEERANQFVKKAKNDPDWALRLLLTLSKKAKERTELETTDRNYLNPSSFGNYFKPIKKLLDMNGVPLVWKRVYTTYPEENNNNTGRGYTREEIQRMIKKSKSDLTRAVILVASSSGIREGAFNLKWKNLLPVYLVGDEILLEITESQEKKAKVICAILQIYHGTSAYYPAFITPEAYDAIMEYQKTWSKEVGRMPKSQDPIFKKEGKAPIIMKPTALKQRIQRVLIDSGLRKELPKGTRRHEIPAMNGFRRFFNKINKETLSKDSPLAALIKKEYMMGHTGLIKLDRNYFQSHVLELVKEYLAVVPNLTIDRVEYDQSVIKNLELERDKAIKEKENTLHMFSAEIRDLRRKVARLEKDEKK